MTRVSCDSLAPSSAFFSAWRRVLDCILDAEQSDMQTQQPAVDAWRQKKLPPVCRVDSNCQRIRRRKSLGPRQQKSGLWVARPLPTKIPQAVSLSARGRRDVHALSRAERLKRSPPPTRADEFVSRPGSAGASKRWRRPPLGPQSRDKPGTRSREPGPPPPS